MVVTARRRQAHIYVCHRAQTQGRKGENAHRSKAESWTSEAGPGLSRDSGHTSNNHFKVITSIMCLYKSDYKSYP